MLLVPAALVAAALAPLPAALPAYAAASCQGMPATIEATSGVVTGTPGDDVVVASGTVTSVDTGAGRDLVCTGEHTGTMSVDTGAGSDLVTIGPGSVDLGTGPGDDELYFGRDTAGAPSSLDLGTGRDSMLVYAVGMSVSANLQEHVFHLGSSTSELRHAEVVSVLADTVALRGDGERNTFDAAGCRVRLWGGPGADVLREVRQDEGVLDGCTTRARLFGGPGDDRLRGFSGDDLLNGGPGQDTAYGAGGSDRCIAEVRQKCER
jgi:Ca2+-binding RTX toxin-like protein